MGKKKYNPQHKNMQNNQKYGAVAPTPHSPTQNDTRLTSLCCPPVATAFPLLHLFLQMEIVWLYPDPTKAPPEGQGFLRSSTGASGSMRRGPMIAGVVG